MTEVRLIAHTRIDPEAMESAGYSRHNEWDDETKSWLNFCSDELAEMAGRLCYLSYDRPNPETASNRDYLANIIRQGHESVLSHASASFLITTTRACAHEIIRHRFLSFSEVSQRYVDPRKILNHAGHDDSHELHVRRYENRFKHLREDGVPLKAARGEARNELPLGFPTIMMASGNLRAWRDFLKQRLSPAADAEIRRVAEMILAELRAIAPNTFQDFDTVD